MSRAGGRKKEIPTISAWGGGVEGGRSRQGAEAEPHGSGKSWRAWKRGAAGLRCSGFRWVGFFSPREVAALLPEKVSMAFIAQCSSGQSTKA